jgi:tetratricopeptide (TPR) repeat protein
LKRLLIAVLLTSLAAAQQRSPGLAAYERANNLFREHKFQDSMNALEEALRLDPKLVPALTLRARLAMAANRYDVAKASLEQAIAADPKFWYAQFLYGFQFYQQNEMPAAIEALQKAQKLNPRDPQSALYLGLAEEALGRTSDALELYRRAIGLEETEGVVHVETLLTGARLLAVQDRLEEAAALIERAAKTDPGSRDPHFEFARLWLKRDDASKAIAEGEAALRLKRGDITDRQVEFVLVRAYRAAGRDRDAQEHAAAIRALDDTERLQTTGRKHPN